MVAIVTVIPGDLSTLIDFYSFSIWLSYAATVLALIILRFTQPNLPRPYKVCYIHEYLFCMHNVTMT